MGCGGSKKSTSGDSGSGDYKSSPYRDSPRNRGNASSRYTNNNNNDDDYYSRNNYKNYNNSSYSPRRTQPHPQSKYTQTNGEANGDFQEANDKGYKRRIRNHLIEATSGTDMDALEKAKERFENNRMEDCGDLTRANERIAYLKMKRDLRDAIRRSNVGVLERTIETAENSQFAGQLQPQIEAAERKLAHLRELNTYNHDILAMDQHTISEIHSYHRPPACVHDVMAASFMLLGHEESTLRDWSYLQAMAGRVGKEGLLQQVRDFDPNNVEGSTATRVREILNYHDLGEVRLASNGAATFHVWSSNIVDMIEKDKAEEEDRRRREEAAERRKKEQMEATPPPPPPPATKGRKK